MRGDFHGHAFLPLLGEPRSGQSLDQMRSRLNAAAPAWCVEPPLGGLAFISTGGEVPEMLDTWWGHSVPEAALPVLLMFHEPGLDGWVGDLDAEVVVGVARQDELGLYAGVANVRAVVTQDVRTLTERAMERYAACFGGQAAGAATLPDQPADPGVTPYRPRVPMQQGAVAAQRPAGAVEKPAFGPPAGQAGGRPARQSQPARSGLGRDFRTVMGRATSLLGSGLRRSWVPDELTTLALSHQTGKIVGVTSRAGGVGKTAIAAALGIIYGEAVQDSGWCAAVVDQNIGNPDQWGRLSLTAQVRTVFEIMSDIEAGREWTVPAWNRTPALAVYPERRDLGDGYAPGQIERFAAQLRQLHMMTVVDLPNRIPSFSSAEAAVCAGWVAASDMLLLPTTDDPTRLQGVLDYLQAPLVKGSRQAGKRQIPVIVPYVRSPLRAVRDDPGVRGLLEQVRQRVLAVVEIPKNERATLAIVKGRPITEVDSSLRDAYIELALTVARAMLAAPGGSS